MCNSIGNTNFSRPTNVLESTTDVTTKLIASVNNISQVKTYLQKTGVSYTEYDQGTIINWHSPGNYQSILERGTSTVRHNKTDNFIFGSDLALCYAMSSDKSKYLESIKREDAIVANPMFENNPSFRNDLYLPEESYLSSLSNISDALHYVILSNEDTPIYKKSYKWYVANCCGFDVLTFARKNDCSFLCWYNPYYDYRGHEVYAFSTKGNIKSSLETISTDIITKLIKFDKKQQKDITTQNKYSSICSINNATEDFKVNLFCKPEDITNLIDGSMHLGVPEDCFYDAYRNKKINAQPHFDRLDKIYNDEQLKFKLNKLLCSNRQHAIIPIVNAILKRNSTRKLEYQKTNLINIGYLYYAFQQGYTDTIKSFATAILTSYLSPKDKGEILASTTDDDRYPNGFNIAMKYNNTEAVLEYLATIFNYCETGDELYSILETIKEKINNSPQTKALSHNRCDFFTKYTKMILAEEKLNDEQKTLLMLGQNKKGSQTLDIAINKNHHDMAIFFIDTVIKSDLKDSLKMSLLSSKILSYGYDESLAEILNSGKAKAFFTTIKEVLAKINISNKDKIEILSKKSDKNVSFLTKLFG